MMENESSDVPGSVSSEAPRDVEGRPISVGAVLREARERLGLNVDDVVKRIKFAPRQIAALEADDFSQLPEIAFVRGFVRSYARLVQLDPTPLLAALPHEPAAPILVAENTLTEVPFPNASSSRKHNIIWLAAALVVALALVLFTLLYGRKSSAPNPPAEPQVKVETLELPSMVLLPDSEVLPDSQSAVSAVPAQGSVAAAGSPEVHIPPEAKPPVESSAPKVRNSPVSIPAVEFSAPSLRVDTAAANRTAGAPAQAVDPSAANVGQNKQGAMSKDVGTFRLTFDQDAWVEVKDKNGKTLLSQLNYRGSELSLSGRPPLALVIGNAKSVHLYYQGRKVDLGPHINVEVARLTLE